MVLGLTAEAYVVYWAYDVGTNPLIASIDENLLFFTSFSAAKSAAEEFIAFFVHDLVPPPKYVWIEPISKLWIDGED